MTKGRVTTALLNAGLVLTATSSLVAAQSERAGPPEGSGEAKSLATFLALSEEQQVSWQALHEKHVKDTEPLREQGRRLGQRLRDALRAEDVDPERVKVATLAMNEHKKKIEASQEAFRGELKQLLNEEQKQKFDAFVAARGASRRNQGSGGKEPRRKGKRSPNPSPSPAATTPPPIKS